MSMVVDLPAPFGPSNATVSPRDTEMSTLWTARTAPNDLTNPTSRIAVVQGLEVSIIIVRFAVVEVGFYFEF